MEHLPDCSEAPSLDSNLAIQDPIRSEDEGAEELANILVVLLHSLEGYLLAEDRAWEMI